MIPDASAAGMRVAASPSVIVSHPDFPRRRVLVLDGDPAARSALASLLEGDGFEVQAVGADGASLEGLDDLDVVVSVHREIEPWLLHLLDEVRSRFPAAQLYSVTPGRTLTSALEAFGVHPRQWFVKPLPYDDLVESLNGARTLH